MPQLPSGRHVGLSLARVLDIARQGNLALTMHYGTSIKSPHDLLPLVDIVYYRPIEGEPPPGKPYLSDLGFADIESEKCDWPVEDVLAMQEVMKSGRGVGWLQAQYDELSELIRTVQPPLPENLRGIFDGDD